MLVLEDGLRRRANSCNSHDRTPISFHLPSPISAYSLSTGAIKVKELTALCKLQPHAGGGDDRHRQSLRRARIRDGGARRRGAADHRLRAGDPPRRQRGARPPRQAGRCPIRWCCWCRTRPATAIFWRWSARPSSTATAPRRRRSISTSSTAHSDGLILLTGGPAGPVGRLARRGPGRRRGGACWRDSPRIFPGRLYVELMRHGLPRSRTASRRRSIDLAYKHDLPLVATNDVFFAERRFYEAHDALLCIADGTTVSNADRRRLTPRALLQVAAGDARCCSPTCPRRATTRWSSRSAAPSCRSRAQPILPPFADRGGRREAGAARRRRRRGSSAASQQHVFQPRDERAPSARRRRKPYRERLDFELDVIETMGFAGYFLIVADFIHWAKAHGIPVGPGRGSGAGSVVAWSLTITDLDPLRFGLLFERFLNPERVSMPDFDIDFCQDRRDEVIRYVQERYGARPRRADHHLRQAAGARGAARCRPRAGDALRPGRPHLQAGAEQSRRRRSPCSRRSRASRCCSRCATATRPWRA